MGFWGNLLTGKPAFEAQPSEPSGSSDNSGNQSPGQPSQTTPSGPKQIPRVTLERTQCHNNGSNMRVECVIQNDSQDMLFFDRIFMINNTKTELNRQLRPGEQWEFTVYNGPRPTQTGGTYDDAKLEFRDSTNDYFADFFAIEFRHEPDNTYSVNRLRSAGQKDI